MDLARCDSCQRFMPLDSLERHHSGPHPVHVCASCRGAWPAPPPVEHKAVQPASRPAPRTSKKA